jgi:CheY-like chemotaxis protein
MTKTHDSVAERAGIAARTLVAVIEDDADIRAVLRFLLEDAGYRVVEAADGKAGCDLLRGSAEGLVALVDHKMPVMDGCDVLGLAASDEDLRRRHVFILVTASPARAEEDCGEALDELDAPVVPKPFNIDEVLDAVAEAARRLDDMEEVAG